MTVLIAVEVGHDSAFPSYKTCRSQHNNVTQSSVNNSHPIFSRSPSTTNMEETTTVDAEMTYTDNHVQVRCCPVLTNLY